MSHHDFCLLKQEKLNFFEHLDDFPPPPFYGAPDKIIQNYEVLKNEYCARVNLLHLKTILVRQPILSFYFACVKRKPLQKNHENPESRRLHPIKITANVMSPFLRFAQKTVFNQALIWKHFAIFFIDFHSQTSKSRLKWLVERQ